jgi:uncharacterized protein YjbI with pentapeptide repeats
MADLEQEAILRNGVTLRNNWRSDNPKIKPDLSGADFSRLTNTTLKRANLDDCDLRNANLDFAYLKETSLRRAMLEGARCHNVTFSEADLTDA